MKGNRYNPDWDTEDLWTDKHVRTDNGVGFRRRCGWCGVELGWWQLNLCRGCRQAVSAVMIGTDLPDDAPCPEGVRWNEPLDRPPSWWMTWWKTWAR